MNDLDLDELRAELNDFAQPEKAVRCSAQEERIIAGFEEIQRYVAEHGHAPRHGEESDIFERLYAVRLDRLRALAECRSILLPLDTQGLLTIATGDAEPLPEAMSEDELLAELAGAAGTSDITELRHVRTNAEKRAAEEIANREPCADFETFKHLFVDVERDLENDTRTTRPFVKDAGLLKADITQGQFFVLGGQVAYIAEVGENFRAPNGENDARLRVVYSNGTESNLLRRSLQRALYKDEAGRRITEPYAGPLFANESEEGDQASGTIYVLRSKSENPFIAANRKILHKIGVTGGEVARRIGNASLDPTYLMAEVEIIATYDLYNVGRRKLEQLIHRIFEAARVDVELKDRFGNAVNPREWFLVPLSAVDEAVERIKDGSITEFIYDPEEARVKRI